MNAFAASLLWGVLQVTLFTIAGWALYLVARRRGPAAGALAAAASLSMAIGVSALALAPWPHWMTLAPSDAAVEAETAADETVNSTEAPASPAAAKPSPSPASPLATKQLSRTDAAAAAWRAFWQELRTTPAEAPQAEGDAWRPRWPEVFGAVFIAGLALALVRLTLGLVAVRRLRAKTTPIADPSLVALAADLSRRLNAARPIELGESRQLASPATVGWRRPLVILPSDWREWTAAERRVVLAHEIAHVGRGDYLTGVLAQFSVALHFYHPLVHWLARRLRLELELAADALGAEASGGREAYLITLAQMALRNDDRAIAWAARPFLPSRGAFLRRIDMLRDPKQFRSAVMSRGRQFVIIACVAAAGLLFAGLRGPQGQSLAQQPAKTTPKSQGDVDWTFVPPNPAALAIVRPAALLSGDEMQPLVKLFNEQVGFEKVYGLSVSELDEVKAILPNFPDPGVQPTEAVGVFVLRAKTAHDWKAFGEQAAGKSVAAEFLGKSYAKPAERPLAYGYFLADERTIVLASETQLQRVIALAKNPAAKPDWADQWPAGDAAAMVDLKTFNRLQGAKLKEEVSRQPAIASFSPIWEQTERLFLSAGVADGLQLTVTAQCGSAEDAEKVQKTADAALTLVSNILAQMANQVAAAPNKPEGAGAKLVLADLATELLKQAAPKTEGNRVRLSTRVKLDVVDTAISVLGPAVTSARVAARGAQSANNMKQLMIAMHNYHDVYKHFPAAAIIGPDGKTLHSWRVAVLPFVDQRELYDQYKFDEPWDSENNKKLLEKMPAVFRHPAAENLTDSCYYALTGDTTLFPGTKGIELLEVRDGTSNTIAIVEAKRSIPWTKPEDIPYDPAKQLPKLGGFEPGKFLAALADGSVRRLPVTIDETTLRALITRAGGEVIGEVPLAD